MATYDVLSVYPEGKTCDCCKQTIKNNFFITISGRTVCSYKCKNDLKPSPSDSCYICKKPVWEGNCYATRTKCICGEKCKDLYLREIEKSTSRNSGKTNEDLVYLKINYGRPFHASQTKQHTNHRI